MLIAKRNQRLPNRFWSKVDIKGPNECWEWQGTKSEFGHGFFWRDGKQIRAHRMAWELANGTIPKGEGYHGYCICHKCDNPPCVNPNHLFIGTMKDNIIDCCSKSRKAITKGENASWSKLSNTDVIKIRGMGSQYSQRTLGKMFGVSCSMIHKIITRKLWRHLP